MEKTHFLYFEKDKQKPCLLAPDFIDEIAELEIIDFIKKMSFNFEGTFVDIGAHIGFYSIPMARIFQNVYSFEPSPFQLSFLVKNKSINQANNINIFDCALGESVTDKQLYIMGRSGGSNTLLPEIAAEGNPMNTVSVQVRTLDSLNIPKVEIVKIDAEGFESEIIMGGFETIRKYRPIMFCEVWKKESHMSKFRQIMNYLEYEFEYMFENFPEMAFCKPR